jgi:hypothetical protein
LVEEPLDDPKNQIKNHPKRNFHEEIRPEKRMENQIGDLLSENSDISNQLTTHLEESDDESVAAVQAQQKLSPEQVPFKDLESLFVK